MKKLMIGFAAVMCAIMASAASFDWKTSATGKIYSAGTVNLLASGTAYLFDNASVSRQSVLTYFIANSTMASGSLDTKSVSAGAIATDAANLVSWGNTGDTLNAFVAIIDGSNILISDLVPGTAQATMTTTLSFSMKTASQAAAIKSPTFSAGGWYTTGAVPEPTSGLLLLLGMAGLALKRKRA